MDFLFNTEAEPKLISENFDLRLLIKSNHFGFSCQGISILVKPLFIISSILFSKDFLAELLLNTLSEGLIKRKKGWWQIALLNKDCLI